MLLIILNISVANYSKFFSGQRISPPNKSKTQLQICKHNEEQATFVFVNPLGKEASFCLLIPAFIMF